MLNVIAGGIKLFDTILFDLDGTLTDPFEGISNSVIYALKKFGIAAPEKTLLKKFIGPPLTESFSKYCGLSSSDALRAVEYYREYFAATGIFENKPYTGVQELLSELKKSGFTVVVATSKPEQFAKDMEARKNCLKRGPIILQILLSIYCIIFWDKKVGLMCLQRNAIQII